MIAIHKLSILLITLGICSLSQGQAQSVHCSYQLLGRLTDARTGTAIEDARLTLHASVELTAKSGSSGQFAFKKLCMQSYALRIERIGYETKDTTIDLRSNMKVDISLRVSPIHLEDIHITHNQSSTMTNSVHRISAVQLEENRGKVLGQLLDNISGVSTLSTGNNIVKPIINGLHSNRILLLNNGVRQEGQQWGVEHAPELDPFAMDEIEVVKGAQAVRYGADALAGVILTAPKALDYSKSLGGGMNLIANSNGRGLIGSARLSGSIHKKIAWRAGLSSKKSGNIKTADYYLGNTGNQELNYDVLGEYLINDHNRIQGYYSHFGTKLGIFEGAHIGTIEDIQARIDLGRPTETYNFSYTINPPYQNISHDLAKIKWNSTLGNENKLEVQYAYQQNRRQEFDLRRVESDLTPLADMVLSTQTLDAILRRDHLTIGVNGIMQVHNNTPGTGTTPIIPNFDNYTAGLFAMQQLHLGRYHVELGVRYDYKYFDVAGYRYDYSTSEPQQVLFEDTWHFHNASGTLGVLYHIKPELNFKSNIGLAWRAPTANELFSDGVHHGSATYEIGDPNLKSERGIKWVNTLLWKQEKVDLTVDIYAQYIYDYIYANPNAGQVRQTIRGTFPIFAYQQQDALFYGTDLSLSYHLSDAWEYGLNASIVRAKDVSSHTYLPYIPSDRAQHYIKFSPDGMGRLQTPYIQLSHKAVARQGRYHEGSDFAPPPAAYQLFGVTVGTKIATSKNQQLGIILQAENLFNTLYKDYMDRFRYYAHQMGRNVSLKINYTF